MGNEEKTFVFYFSEKTKRKKKARNQFLLNIGANESATDFCNI